MSQEIVHTSAESGLKQGSRGFCTVRSTSGMAHNLAMLLEKLTAYNHAYKHFDKKFDDHPVNYVHYTSTLGGARYHILGKVSNAPLDHTSRSNKLAHLVAFDESEIDFSRSAGPAAEIQAIRDENRWVTRWAPEDKPYILPDRERITLPVSAPAAPQPCTTWKRICGDARWAAVLAGHRGDQPIPVIFSASQKDDCLALVAEALSLIPPAERWDVTFSTYFSSSLPTKVKCQWQFLLDTTELGQKARRSLRVKAIDLPLIQEQGLAPAENELSQFADSAERPWLHRKTSAPKTAPHKSPHSPADEEGVTFVAVPEHDRPALEGHRAPAEPFADSDDRQRPWLLWAAVAVILVAAIGVGILTFRGASRPDDVFSQTVAKSDQTLVQERAELEQVVREKVERQQQQQPTEPEVRQSEPGETEESEPPQATSEVAETQTTIADPLQPETSTEPLPEKHRPLDDVRDRGNRLVIGTPATTTGPVALATIYVDSAEDFELDIIGEESVMKLANYNLLSENPRDGLRTWTLTKKGVSALDREEPVGMFALDGQQLSFEWSRDGFPDAAVLRNCILQIRAESSAGPDDTNVVLREPEILPRLELKLISRASKVELVRQDELQSTEQIRFDFQLANSLSNQLVCKGSTSLHVDDSSVIQLFENPAASRTKDEKPLVETKLTLQASDVDKTVHIQQESTFRWYEIVIPEVLRSNNGDQPEIETLFTPLPPIPHTDPLTKPLLREIEKQAVQNDRALQNWIDRLKVLKARYVKERKDAMDDASLKKINNLIQATDAQIAKVQKEHDIWKRIPDRLARSERLFQRIESEAALHFELVLDVPGSDKPVVLAKSKPE